MHFFGINCASCPFPFDPNRKNTKSVTPFEQLFAKMKSVQELIDDKMPRFRNLMSMILYVMAEMRLFSHLILLILLTPLSCFRSQGPGTSRVTCATKWSGYTRS